MSEDKTFTQPVVIHLHSIARDIHVRNARQAFDSLTALWPGRRSDRHRDAVEICLKVFDGDRSAEDARTALIEAAREAGLLSSQKRPPQSIREVGLRRLH